MTFSRYFEAAKLRFQKNYYCHVHWPNKVHRRDAHYDTFLVNPQ